MKKYLQNNIGASLVLISAVFYASHGVWSKSLNPYFDELTTSWTRSLIVLALLTPYLLYTKGFKKFSKKDKKWMAIIAIPGGVVTPLYFYAFQHLSVGVATLTFFTLYTLTAMVLGKFYFAEEFGKSKIIALCLGLIGLLIINSRSFGGELTAVMVCALAGICSACEVVFTKKLSGNYSAFYITFWLFVSTGVMAIGAQIFLRGFEVALPMTVKPWLLSVGYAVAIISALGLVIEGYKHVQPGLGAIVGLSEVVFGVLLGVLFYREKLSLSVVVGSVLILLAGITPVVFRSRSQPK